MLVEKTKEFERFYNEEYPHSTIGCKSSREAYEESVKIIQNCLIFSPIFRVNI